MLFLMHQLYLWQKKMLNDSVKTVTTLHGTDVTIMSEDPSLKEIMEFSVDDADAITAVSDSLRLQALDSLNINQDIKRIYNFIDPLEYKRECQANLKKNIGLEENIPVLVHTSNFRPVKRIGDLIDIFNGVRSKMKCKLVLIGDGPERCMASRKVIDYGLEEDVLFLGKQNNVIELLSIGDVFYFYLLKKEKFLDWQHLRLWRVKMPRNSHKNRWIARTYQRWRVRLFVRSW